LARIGHTHTRGEGGTGTLNVDVKELAAGKIA
jgi:hypothetical protein